MSTNSGDLQRFQVPAGATRLFLGMVDDYDLATDTISGNPGIYDDNGGDDLYQFDADNKLGKIIVEETNDGGTDSLDFSLTTIQNIAVNLNFTTVQAVNSNLALQLNSRSFFENLIGRRARRRNHRQRVGQQADRRSGR